MSLASWKKEHYKRTANAFRFPRLKRTPVPLERQLAAVEHSLAKWEGMRPLELQMHELEANDCEIYSSKDGASLGIDTGSCALCVLFYPACSDCPLYKALDGYACDEKPPELEAMSPFGVWTEAQNPEPMIRALEKARTFILKQIKEENGNDDEA